MPVGLGLSGQVRVRIALAACGTLLLGGCFLAENDESDPIIPDAALVYPMKVGPARQCTESSDGEPVCSRALLEKRLGGGYSVTVWEKNSEGKEEKGSPKEYRLRRLEGQGVPNATFLVQLIADDVDSRFLGLLKRRADGGWEQLEPQCEQLVSTRFAEFITNRWIITKPDATLDDVTCTIVRDGLTDGRFYAILDAPKKTSTTVLYTRK
jgi:hypothetical protein